MAEENGGDDMLHEAVAAALRLPLQEQQVAVPAAVRTVLDGSEDRAGAARALRRALDNARPRLPALAAPLLARVSAELAAEQALAPDGSAPADAASSSSDDSDADEGDERRPFAIGAFELPLSTLLNITNCLEPDDLTPAAGACKSLCVPININLQYMLFLMRLLRLIVLGPEMARQLREREADSDDSSEP